MLHGPSHPGVAGSELTRLLAALADHPPPALTPPFAERLGQWLGWVGAISLSSALNVPVALPAAAAAARDSVTAVHEADVDRARAALAAKIAAGPDEGDPSPTDFRPYHHHCLALQRSMQEAVDALRQRLRAALLARACPALARLAAIDAVMDRTLAPQEHSLLGLVPLRLRAHFDRLRRSAPNDDGAWINHFRDDMACLLQAELAHRLLPVSGLLEALRAPQETFTT
jgi:hypothetical protein